MKKIALVATLAAIAAPAFAQSSVTLYGRINTTIESQSFDSGSRIATVSNNASRIGFKGVEDLGGGLKASFVLESGLNSDDGKATSTSYWGRESQVQLAGAFGAVRLGNWFPGSYYASADYVSLHNHDTGSSADAFYGGPFLRANKVAYFTPNMGGFSGELAVTAGEGAKDPFSSSNAVVDHGYDAAGNYDMGPLHLGAGYSKRGDFEQFSIRGLYELGAFTVGGYWQVEDTNVGNNSKRNIGRVSGMYTMGASEFHVNVGGTESGGAAGYNGHGAWQYTFGYNYNLSKRTKIYGYYTAIDVNDVKKGDFDSFAIGIRHNF